MKNRNLILTLFAIFSVAFFATDVWAAGRGGGGGGARAGGGSYGGGGARAGGSSYSRSSGSRYSGGASGGGGSIRYANRGNGGTPVSVKSSAAYQNRLATAQNVANGHQTGYTSSSYQPSRAAVNRAANTGIGSTYRPANYGSITGPATRPGTGTGGKVIPGPNGGTWGIARTPGGGVVIGHQGANGGGSVTAIGPNGGSARYVRGPGGGVGGVIRGPAGGAVGAVKGPGGTTVAGVRTRYGGAAAVATLPNGSVKVAWRGNNYWHNGNNWYYPYWQGDTVYYQPAYPPYGYWEPATDWQEDQSQPVVVNNNTYYESDGTYYEKTTQNGQEGYTVVADPTQAAASTAQPELVIDPNLPNPLDMLKSGLDYLAQQQEFTMSVSDNYEEITDNGAKVSFTSRRNVVVRRPGNVAIDYGSDIQARRVVYDGYTLTLVDRKNNAYGQASITGTIDTVLDKLAQEYGITVAVGELLRTNLYDRLSQKIETAQYLGKDMFAVFECHHLAFTTANIDMEVWVDTGDQPMIRKVSMVYKNEPTRPRYTMTILSFDTSSVSDSSFAVTVPKGAVEVNLAARLAGSPAQGTPAQ